MEYQTLPFSRQCALCTTVHTYNKLYIIMNDSFYIVNPLQSSINSSLFESVCLK